MEGAAASASTGAAASPLTGGLQSTTSSDSTEASRSAVPPLGSAALAQPLGANASSFSTAPGSVRDGRALMLTPLPGGGGGDGDGTPPGSGSASERTDGSGGSVDGGRRIAPPPFPWMSAMGAARSSTTEESQLAQTGTGAASSTASGSPVDATATRSRLGSVDSNDDDMPGLCLLSSTAAVARAPPSFAGMSASASTPDAAAAARTARDQSAGSRLAGVAAPRPPASTGAWAGTSRPASSPALLPTSSTIAGSPNTRSEAAGVPACRVDAAAVLSAHALLVEAAREEAAAIACAVASSTVTTLASSLGDGVVGGGGGGGGGGSSTLLSSVKAPSVTATTSGRSGSIGTARPASPPLIEAAIRTAFERLVGEMGRSASKIGKGVVVAPPAPAAATPVLRGGAGGGGPAVSFGSALEALFGGIGLGGALGGGDDADEDETAVFGGGRRGAAHSSSPAPSPILGGGGKAGMRTPAATLFLRSSGGEWKRRLAVCCVVYPLDCPPACIHTLHLSHPLRLVPPHCTRLLFLQPAGARLRGGLTPILLPWPPL